MRHKVILMYRYIAIVLYSLASFMLLGTSFILIYMSAAKIWKGFIENNVFHEDILNSISSLVIAIAIINVAKYLAEEEIAREKELQHPHEARRTLTRVFVVISISVSLKGLVYIFKAGETNIALLLYPSSLVLVSALSMFLLGIYQKMSVATEKMLGNHYAKQDCKE